MQDSNLKCTVQLPDTSAVFLNCNNFFFFTITLGLLDYSVAMTVLICASFTVWAFFIKTIIYSNWDVRLVDCGLFSGLNCGDCIIIIVILD